MPFKRTVMRFAHTAGYTHCCYTDDGEYLISCGSDGDIRIWHGIDDDDPTSQCVGEFIIAITHYAKRMLASTDLNTVQAYTFPDGDRDGTEFRFTAPVTCIKVNKKFIAAGSEDTIIKISYIDKCAEEFELTGHEGPILHVDLNKNDLLASSSGDGTIKIWNLIDKKVIKTISGFEKVKSFYAATCFISPIFEPKHGNNMGYISQYEIIIVNTDSWDTVHVLKDEKITSPYSICCYSPCGKYLAAGTCVGEISVWNMKTCQLIKGDTKGTDAQAILAIEWDPRNNGELAYTDNTGQLGTVINCYDSESTINTNDFLNDEAIEDDADNDDDVNDDLLNDLEFVNDDDDEDNDNCISLEKLKNETLKPSMNNHDDDTNSLLDDNKTNRSISAADNRSIVNIPATHFKEYPLQTAFQSSETPRHLEHRYLVWNHIGIVRGHSSDTEESIEVEFHDVNIHHGLHMSNHLHHTMASLSSTVLALACETPSKLVAISLGYSGSREWSISLPNLEEIIAVGAADKLIAIATDQRFIRLFSVMGTQREILCIPGPAVTVCGHNDKILVVYHNSSATADQHMSMLLIQTIGLSIKSRDVRLPLTAGGKLKWIGFSDCGSPVCYDSMGMIRMFNIKSNYWMPILDTSIHIRNASDNYFIIDVSEENQIIRAILCRGSLYPMTNPRPIISELKMQIPMCNIETEKTVLEEELIRCANLNVINSEQKLTGIALKLFALACRTEMEIRAKELIEIIASPQLLPHAVKYASKIGRMHLAEKLSELLPQLEEEEKQRDKLLNDVELEAINILQNSPMNPMLLIGQKEEKPSTPHIAPMVMSHRNPFKKGVTKTPLQNIKNPLSHLTKKAIGYDSQNDESQQLFDDINDSQNTDSDIPEITPIITTPIINKMLNNGQQQHQHTTNNEEIKTTPMTFQIWFSQNKEQLKLEWPDMKPQEFSKCAVSKYKSLFGKDKDKSSNGNVVNGNPSMKRKLEIEDDNDNVNNNNNNDDSDMNALKKQSGISKLAKFGFKK